MRLIAADGRPYLALTKKRYDLMLVDAYRQPYVPFYLATEEFFALARKHLRPGGAIALNVAATPHDRRLSNAIGTTLLTAFPQAWRWRALEFNDVLFALREPVTRAELERRAFAPPGWSRACSRSFAAASRRFVRTEDRSPTTALPSSG